MRRTHPMVYAFGSPSKGKLGLMFEVADFSVPRELQALSRLNIRVVSVAAGAWTSFALTDMGDVYGWGLARNGRLPLPENYFKSVRSCFANSEVIEAPIKLETLGYRIVQVAAGGYHGLFLTECGKVLAFGCNQNGQCSHVSAPYGHRSINNEQFILKPKVVTMGPLYNAQVHGKIVSIYAGWKTSGLLTEDGSAWLFGSNCCGQIGDGVLLDRILPAKIEIVENSTPARMKCISKIAFGQMHTALLTTDGSVYTMGSPAGGRLGGYSVSSRYQSSPRRIESIPAAVDVCTGYFHTCILTVQGTVYVCGGNSEGQCGTGDMHDVMHPVQLQLGGRAVSIAAGGFSTMFTLVDDSKRSHNILYSGIEWSTTSLKAQQQQGQNQSPSDDDVVLSEHQIATNPRPVSLPAQCLSATDKHVQISCGGSHILLCVTQRRDKQFQYQLHAHLNSRSLADCTFMLEA